MHAQPSLSSGALFEMERAAMKEGDNTKGHWWPVVNTQARSGPDGTLDPAGTHLKTVPLPRR